MQLLKIMLQRDADPETNLFLSSDAKITVLKSIELSNSGNAKNNGSVVSFVKFTVSGVDYYTVQYFKKDQAGGFNLSGLSYVPEKDKSSEDKATESAIAEFKKTGKL